MVLLWIMNFLLELLHWQQMSISNQAHIPHLLQPTPHFTYWHLVKQKWIQEGIGLPQSFKLLFEPSWYLILSLSLSACQCLYFVLLINVTTLLTNYKIPGGSFIFVLSNLVNNIITYNYTSRNIKHEQDYELQTIF